MGDRRLALLQLEVIDRLALFHEAAFKKRWLAGKTTRRGLRTNGGVIPIVSRLCRDDEALRHRITRELGSEPVVIVAVVRFQNERGIFPAEHTMNIEQEPLGQQAVCEFIGFVARIWMKDPDLIDFPIRKDPSDLLRPAVEQRDVVKPGGSDAAGG